MLGAWSLVLSGSSLSAQTTPVSLPAVSSRYLFIVETSRTMQPRTAGAQRAVRELLASSMRGQLRRGDSLGVWTFNDTLYTGKFPLQKWSLEAKDEIATSVASFVGNQKCEKKADFNPVVPALDKLVRGSDYITIILVTDGEERITGTPYNGQINEFFQLWRDQQRKAQMPFLTILRASHGTITHYAMNTAPWVVEMPPLAPEIQALAEAEKKPAAPPKVQTSSVPPLIFRGKNPEPVVPMATVTNVPVLAGTSTVAGVPPSAGSATVHIAEPHPSNNIKVSGQKPAVPGPTAKLEPKPKDGDKLTAAQPNPPLASASNAGASSTEASPPVHPMATAEPASNRNLFVIAGLVLGAGVLVFAVVWLRRPRTQSVSAITRSLEREKEDL
jgi:hypothetical protein